MAPKPSAAKDKDLVEEDEVLQAVILADSFNKRFRPMTVGKPRCLLPICNATLLDWTFESLAMAGVQEIFVICRSYADLVKAAIRDSKWSKPSSGLKIVPIVTAKETYSPGDAMRDIYTHGIITSDFILVMGDLVSNIRIDEVVRAHKERRRTNKDAIMTIVVKESGAQHRTRSRGESAVFVLDPQTSECLHYEPVIGYPHKTHAQIPREILAEHPEVEIRNDLIDCSIDICSTEVPSLFQDNFDYADIRRDFVYGVLTSDLLMKNIHCYVARDGYAARVADTRSYDAISKDILSRWTFPLVPDNNHPGGDSYEHLRGNKYIPKDNSVVLSRTCKVGPNTLIGAHSIISDNASVSASVIGERCTIGPGAVLRGAYVFNDTHIGAGTHVEESIIGANVRIGEDSTIHTGCLIADDVVLGKNARLDKFERVSKRREVSGDDADDEEDDEEWERVEAHQSSVTSFVGKGSNAIVWPQAALEAEDEEAEPVESFNNQRLMRIGDTAEDLELSDAGSVTESESGSDTDTEASSSRALSRTSSMTSASVAPDVTGLHNLHANAAESEFRSEVKQSLDRAFAEGHSVDNAAVELKTLRMASNVPLRRVREAVVEAIVERIGIVEGNPTGQRKEIAKTVERWGPLIDKIGGVDAVETVEVLQHHCAHSSRLPLFGQILAALYQADIVEEEDIRTWHARPSSRGEGHKPGPVRDGLEKCWAVGSHMIEQFDEQESEEESDEESEEEEKKESVSGEGGEKRNEEQAIPIAVAPAQATVTTSAEAPTVMEKTMTKVPAASASAAKPKTVITAETTTTVVQKIETVAVAESSASEKKPVSKPAAPVAVQQETKEMKTAAVPADQETPAQIGADEMTVPAILRAGVKAAPVVTVPTTQNVLEEVDSDQDGNFETSESEEESEDVAAVVGTSEEESSEGGWEEPSPIGEESSTSALQARGTESTSS
ncbi:nucleotide-diphospho-sugar transferase [Laetiporus sulphureus 93-53]|uniref:Translation initiation factor eIF2B subunit epsilon n=1 Tax=Laetiporus sulphureus 93-53 TaxID=1314785 RepID=A0A165H4R0_9APHY|nr:nucleotide-diphospho-sugar transferase [Laetiporus sulphureus 93-53]KZT11243.1 nucleotide-diphospho-sugar transferase [Laetiporus sulphureus 93-53]